MAQGINLLKSLHKRLVHRLFARLRQPPRSAGRNRLARPIPGPFLGQLSQNLLPKNTASAADSIRKMTARSASGFAAIFFCLSPQQMSFATLGLHNFK
jgi:hypothetical protein